MESDQTQQAVADALRRIARNTGYKDYVMRTPLLHNVLLRPVLPFIGGETLAECRRTAQTLNGQGFATSIDHMGENARSTETAHKATREFLCLIQAIADSKLDSAISLDLSHIGLAVSPELAFENLSMLAREAAAVGIEVMLNMEESERTSAILDTHSRVTEKWPSVGVTLQAYLYRTDNDLALALRRPGRIRLVKGAYREPPDLARPLGLEVDAAYQRYVEVLLHSGHPCWIATHDPALLDHAHGHIRRRALPSAHVEFEFNFGVRRDQWVLARDRGHRTRIYLPYGEEWFLYLCHRMAEHPPSLAGAVAASIDALIDESQPPVSGDPAPLRRSPVPAASGRDRRGWQGR